MKALCLGLVKGSIDQVEQKVHMTWVQPRVLDKDQVIINSCVVYSDREYYILMLALWIANYYACLNFCVSFADWNNEEEA